MPAESQEWPAEEASTTPSLYHQGMDNNKCWMGVTGILPCAASNEYGAAAPNVWRLLRSSTEAPYDPEIPLLGIFTRETKTQVCTKTRSEHSQQPMHTTPRRHQPQRPLTKMDKQDQAHPYKEYYPAMRTSEF